MANTSSYKRKQKFALILSGLFLVAALLWFFAKAAGAQSISYDPYADSVAGSSPIVADPNNAVGAPNNTNASLVGPGASITLDMGAGEEGTQTLRLYLGQINAQVNVDVAFLDSNKAVIKSENRQLGVDLNPSAQNFAYNWTNFGKAYRYVRVSSTLGGGVNVDAVEALGYIGSSSTQDTDGDGRTDRSEQANGTNPLVANPAPAPSQNSGNGVDNPARPVPGSGGVSAQVNNPPKTNNDKDGDGMADSWERANGLNPNDAKDATGDPDHDKLTNLTEFRIGSNPQKLDTDGDGMPDNWEYEHGLDVNKNDADADRDGDFLTNLGEYRYGTDPNKADNLYVVFGKNCLQVAFDAWEWLVFALLLAGSLLSGAAAYSYGRKAEAKQQKRRK